MDKFRIGQAAWIAMAEMGVIVDRYEQTDDGLIFYMSVPKTSYECEGGKEIARAVKRCLTQLGVKFADCRYKVRDEHWTAEKAALAVIEAKEIVGYSE